MAAMTHLTKFSYAFMPPWWDRTPRNAVKFLLILAGSLSIAAGVLAVWAVALNSLPW